MASSTAKKVVVRRFDRETLTGYVHPATYLKADSIEILRQDGSLLLVPYSEAKSVAFVKDFETESATGRIFLNRPRQQGLWVRMVFLDGEVMDGMLPNNLLIWDAAGFTVTPPEPDGNSQRIFVPRQALRSIQVLGVVGSPLRATRKKPAPADQPTLF